MQTVVARVLGVYVMTALVGLVALATIIPLSLTSISRNRTLTELESLAELAVQVVRSELAPGDTPPAARESLSAGYTLAIVETDGATGSEPGSDSSLPVSVSELASLDGPISGFSQTTMTGVRYAFVIAPIATGDTPGRFLYLTRRLDRPTEDARSAVVIVLATVTVIAAVAGLLIYRSLRWIVKPIYTIQGAARRYATGELSVQLRTNGPSELQRLAEDLNRMSLELRRRIGSISEQRNQLEVILSSMVEGVIVLDDRRGILRMNEAAGRLLGVGFAEAQGRTLIEYLRNAQLDDLAEKAFLSDQPSEHTITIYRDRPLHLQVHATSLRGDQTPNPTGSLLVISDITRLKQLEELRKDFVANVSHELKTPITSIKGFVETLLDEEELDKANRDRFLSIILTHSNRLHLIIEDLLSLSRLEQGDERITFSQFSVHEFVSGALDLVRQAAEEKRIPIEVTVEGKPTAWGNLNLLEQALVNLLDNAIKYSPAGSRVQLVAESDPGALSLRVIDYGPGIRPQDLPRIFERFYRTDAARSREHGGTGLGLAIVKHIARAHGGEVSVQSIVGQGSTFSIEIPTASAEGGHQETIVR